MIERTYPVAGRLDLSCEFSNGSLAVRAREGLTEARVTVAGRDPQLPVEQLFRVELIGNRLEIAELTEENPSILEAVLGGDLRALTRGRGGRGKEVRIAVELPAGTAVRIAARAAAVTTEGRTGPADISTGSSSVELDEVDGPLRIQSGSGTLAVNRVTGPVNVRGGSGALRIAAADSTVSVNVGSGEVAIGAARGSVKVRSGSGSTAIELAESDVDIASSSGPVAIGLAEGRQARLDVATGSGRLHTDMPVQDTVPAGGTLTGIRVRTGSGDVRLHRAVPTPH